LWYFHPNCTQNEAEYFAVIKEERNVCESRMPVLTLLAEGAPTPHKKMNSCHAFYFYSERMALSEYHLFVLWTFTIYIVSTNVNDSRYRGRAKTSHGDLMQCHTHGQQLSRHETSTL
jgi:hypothetical protein